MVTKSATVRLSDEHLDILVRMADIWPAVRDNRSEAIRRAIEQVGFEMSTPGRRKINEEILRGVRRLLEILDPEPAVNTIAAARAAGCDSAGQFDDDGMECCFNPASVGDEGVQNAD